MAERIVPLLIFFALTPALCLFLAQTDFIAMCSMLTFSLMVVALVRMIMSFVRMVVPFVRVVVFCVVMPFMRVVVLFGVSASAEQKSAEE